MLPFVDLSFVDLSLVALSFVDLLFFDLSFVDLSLAVFFLEVLLSFADDFLSFLLLRDDFTDLPLSSSLSFCEALELFFLLRLLFADFEDLLSSSLSFFDAFDLEEDFLVDLEDFVSALFFFLLEVCEVDDFLGAAAPYATPETPTVNMSDNSRNISRLVFISIILKSSVSPLMPDAPQPGKR